MVASYGMMARWCPMKSIRSTVENRHGPGTIVDRQSIHVMTWRPNRTTNFLWVKSPEAWRASHISVSLNSERRPDRCYRNSADGGSAFLGKADRAP